VQLDVAEEANERGEANAHQVIGAVVAVACLDSINLMQ
jgi:hypothetical protein